MTVPHLRVQKITLTVDKDGILNTVSIDGVTLVPSETDRMQRATTSAQPLLDTNNDETANNTEKDEYVGERIFRHIGEKDTL